MTDKQFDKILKAIYEAQTHEELDKAVALVCGEGLTRSQYDALLSYETRKFLELKGY